MAMDKNPTKDVLYLSMMSYFKKSVVDGKHIFIKKIVANINTNDSINISPMKIDLVALLFNPQFFIVMPPLCCFFNFVFPAREVFIQMNTGDGSLCYFSAQEPIAN